MRDESQKMFIVGCPPKFVEKPLTFLQPTIPDHFRLNQTGSVIPFGQSKF